MLKKLYNYSGLRILHGIYEAKRLRKTIAQSSVKDVNELQIKDYKKSDKLFILGSGYSITSLNEKDWEHIKTHDSIGFNAWVFHDHTPTYYCMETPTKSAHFDAILNALNTKKKQYAKVPFIIQYQHLIKSTNNYKNLELPKENVYYNAPFMPNTTSKYLLKKLLQWWASKHSKNMHWLIHYSGSLSYIVAMGYMMGYKEIVLLGVDLNDSRYYFQDQGANEGSKKYAKIHESTMKDMNRMATGSIHDTVNIKRTINYGCLPIDGYLYSFNKIMRKKGVKLSIGNKKSRLSEGLPVYEFPS